MMLNVISSFASLNKPLMLVLVTLSNIVHSQGITCDNSLKGFATLGAGTTGGGNAAPVIVTNIDDFRKACDGNQPAVVKVSGTIVTGVVPVLVGSNKSIIGLDGATINGGLNITYGTSNVIIRYLAIKGAGYPNFPEDAITIRGTSNVWVDHCDLSDAGDGLVDMTKGSDLITVSWNKFSYSNFRFDRTASLIGGSLADGKLDRGKLRVTYLGNYFSTNITEGMGRVRFGQVHFANNFYNSTGNEYVIGVGAEASILVENNVFSNVKNPISIRDWNNTGAFVTETGNIYKDTIGDKFSGSYRAGVTPFTRPPYALDLVPATDVEKLVVACACAKA